MDNYECERLQEIIRALRRKLALAGVEGSPPLGEQGTIQKLQSRMKELEATNKQNSDVIQDQIKQMQEYEAELAKLRKVAEAAKSISPYLLTIRGNYHPDTQWENYPKDFEKFIQALAEWEGK